MGIETGTAMLIAAAIAAAGAVYSSQTAAAATERSAEAQARYQRRAAEAQAQQHEAAALRSLQEKQYMESRRLIELREEKRKRSIRYSENVNNITGLEIAGSIERSLAQDAKQDRLALSTLDWDWNSKIDAKLDQASMSMWDATETRNAGVALSNTTQTVAGYQADQMRTAGYVKAGTKIGEGTVGYFSED